MEKLLGKHMAVFLPMAYGGRSAHVAYGDQDLKDL